MAIAPHGRHPSDVEAPSDGHGIRQKNFRDLEFEDDVDDSQRRNRQFRSRLSALILGLVTLGAVAFGAYFFLMKDGIDLLKGNSQHENFQGSVSMSSIQMHATTGDCWMAIHDNVYDLTDYAPLHPGPSSLITDHCGKDATDAYAAEHSRALLPTVSEYFLGTLEGTNGSSAPPSGFTDNLPSGSTGGGSQIALATMQTHATPGDCWLAYYGNVYDMTQYAPTHPASSTLITNHCGTDATAAYSSAHRRSLLASVERYRLGALEGSTPSSFPSNSNQKPPDESSDD